MHHRRWLIIAAALAVLAGAAAPSGAADLPAPLPQVPPAKAPAV